jgi:uncharacterized protein
VTAPDGARGLAIVTGASSGIGAAFARALSARKYPLLLIARREDRLRKLARELGGDVDVLPLDLLSPDAVARVAEAANARGPIELLVNNAGYATHGAFVTRDAQRELDMVALDARLPLLLSRAVLPSLMARGRGGIINVSSIAAFQAVPWMATYGASKAFLLSLSEALHEELRDTGVHVLCICPGPTATEFFDVADMPGPMRKMPHTMRADEVVDRALDAFYDDRAVLTPGFVNFLTGVLARFFPRLVVRKATGAMFAPRGDTTKTLPDRRHG